mgnify:CR=1 FL=1
MADFFFWAYPWDLDDEGLEVALGRMAGQIGLDAVSVLVVRPHVREIRPRHVYSTRVSEMEAGTYFAPARTCYVNTRIQPMAAAWKRWFLRKVFQVWSPRVRPSRCRIDGESIQIMTTSAMQINSAPSFPAWPSHSVWYMLAPVKTTRPLETSAKRWNRTRAMMLHTVASQKRTK